jgi:hypothetical protein
MKKLVVVTLCLLFAFGAYLSVSTVDNTVSEATAGTSTYSGTIYIAGMGGHFAKAGIVIDPSNTESPITVKSLDRIVIGSKSTHPVHDPRIDINDRTKMFFSTYKPDKSAGGGAHIGIVDLKTGKVLLDKVVKIDKRAEWKGALYCASAQTKNSYMPMTMTNEGYIDVFSKKNLKLKKRVFLDSLGFQDNHFFYHGTNSPDLTKMFLSVNMTQKWAKRTAPAARKGVIENLLLDMKSLEKGKLKILAKNVATGDPKKTLTFRQSFTPDGKYIAQSAADRFYLLDGETLEVIDEEIMELGENHDALTTPDGKYAVLTIRNKIKVSLGAEDSGSTIKDGSLLLYDINAKQVVGGLTSVCYSCHKEMGLTHNSVLCGADVNWK